MDSKQAKRKREVKKNQQEKKCRTYNLHFSRGLPHIESTTVTKGKGYTLLLLILKEVRESCEQVSREQ